MPNQVQLAYGFCVTACNYTRMKIQTNNKKNKKIKQLALLGRIQTSDSMSQAHEFVHKQGT